MLDAKAADRKATTVVGSIRSLLQVDDRWAARTDHGFTWWPHWFRQDVWAEPAQPSRGMYVARVIVESDLARSAATVTATELSSLIAKPGLGDQKDFLGGSWDAVRTLPVLPGLSGLVLRESQLRLRSSVNVHGETQDWMPRLIALAAVEQLDVVERHGVSLATALNAQIAESQHPSSGARDTADEMVGAIRAMASVTGTSSWTDVSEFRTTAAGLTARSFVSTTDEGQGPFRA